MADHTVSAMGSPDVQKDACRLCDESADKMFYVFDKNDEGRQIIHIIKECLPIIIYRSDPLSKKICESCLENLENLTRFKRFAKEIDEKHKERLRASNEPKNKDELLYLGIEPDDVPNENDPDDYVMQGITDACTSTEDLPVLCLSCKQSVVDASTVNGELELSTDLQKIVADTLCKRKGNTETETDKVLRNRRKKPQPFYHELDDSLCSSMTEFTQNTESSHFYDDRSDVESVESDRDEMGRPAKRRRVDYEETKKEVSGGGELTIKISKRQPEPVEDDEPMETEEEIEFHAEYEYRYNPLTLMQLALNVINTQNVPDFVPYDFTKQIYEPECKYCNQTFQNTKILALHEVCHMDVIIDEKIDSPAIWPDHKEDSQVRNKWLAYFDENGYEEDDLVLDQSLLIPIETAEVKEDEDHHDDLVTLDGTKPVVRGIPLSEYSKEERKNFYQSIVVGGVKKRFCQICRYSFKDNWAIESHYFSSACYYTCKYCGMRFNKQRHRFDEHIQEHASRGDPIVLDKIYAPSKVNNYMPKVIMPDKAKRQGLIPIRPHPQPERMYSPVPSQPPASGTRSIYVRKSLQPNLKEEPSSPTGQVTPKTEIITSQSKTGNQAYFCRKCYKVFFKLDEFNAHSKNCDYNQFPGFVASKPSGPTFNAKPTPPPPPPQKNGDSGNRSSLNNRPVRNCAREAGPYKDEAFIPEVVLKEPAQRHTNMAGPPFICFICNTPFPTVYSRNSHMRIHKGEQSSPSTSKPKASHHQVNHYMGNNYENQNYNYDTYIKQEPLEPEVQIHETEPHPAQINSIGNGAVSITPIPKKNSNQRVTINPDIYKLVQDNPSISIKPKVDNHSRYQSQQQQQAASSSHMYSNNTEDKSYKCSSCWEAFANKSHLYFHKKNQCEGSRFPCPFCKKRFGTEAAYSSHIFYSHPE